MILAWSAIVVMLALMYFLFMWFMPHVVTDSRKDYLVAVGILHLMLIALIVYALKTEGIMWEG